jgi:hypothetical protein
MPGIMLRLISTKSYLIWFKIIWRGMIFPRRKDNSWLIEFMGNQSGLRTNDRLLLNLHMCKLWMAKVISSQNMNHLINIKVFRTIWMGLQCPCATSRLFYDIIRIQRIGLLIIFMLLFSCLSMPIGTFKMHIPWRRKVKVTPQYTESDKSFKCQASSSIIMPCSWISMSTLEESLTYPIVQTSYYLLVKSRGFW